MLMGISGLESLVLIRIVVGGREGLAFLVRECIADEVEFITNVRYEESVWMKVRGGRGKEALYLCCVYMPTEGSAAAAINPRRA